MITLKKRSLTFKRAKGASYVDAYGNYITNDGDENSSYVAKGSLQPMSQKEKETIPTRSGVRVASAFYFYTKTNNIKPVGKTTAEADRTVINGESFVVWSNSPWEGVKLTSHNVVVLVKEDEVIFDE